MARPGAETVSVASKHWDEGSLRQRRTFVARRLGSRNVSASAPVRDTANEATQLIKMAEPSTGNRFGGLRSSAA